MPLPMPKANRRLRLMGTVIDLVIYHDKAQLLLDQAEQLLHLYDKRFSANDDQSELMQVNKAAGENPVIVHPQLFELITLGKWHSCQSDSLLNIAIGPLVQTWRIGFSDAQVPSSDTIQKQLPLTNPQDILLNDKEQSVYLPQKGMAIDLGAIAKGYIADRLRDFFLSQGVSSGLINLGGNVLTFGHAPHNPDGKWRIGIQNPKEKRNTNLMMVAIQDQAVVTSGIYERTLETDSNIYHHILDSKTGYPIVSHLTSLTIVSPLSVQGDIWTSKLFGQELETIFQKISQEKGLEAIAIDKDNHIFQSQGIPKLKL